MHYHIQDDTEEYNEIAHWKEGVLQEEPFWRRIADTVSEKYGIVKVRQ